VTSRKRVIPLKVVQGFSENMHNAWSTPREILSNNYQPGQNNLDPGENSKRTHFSYENISYKKTCG
jgi:hypothetical protein